MTDRSASERSRKRSKISATTAPTEADGPVAYDQYSGKRANLTPDELAMKLARKAERKLARKAERKRLRAEAIAAADTAGGQETGGGSPVASTSTVATAPTLPKQMKAKQRRKLQKLQRQNSGAAVATSAPAVPAPIPPRAPPATDLSPRSKKLEDAIRASHLSMAAELKRAHPDKRATPTGAAKRPRDESEPEPAVAPAKKKHKKKHKSAQARSVPEQEREARAPMPNDDNVMPSRLTLPLGTNSYHPTSEQPTSGEDGESERSDDRSTSRHRRNRGDRAPSYALQHLYFAEPLGARPRNLGDNDSWPDSSSFLPLDQLPGFVGQKRIAELFADVHAQFSAAVAADAAASKHENTVFTSPGRAESPYLPSERSIAMLRSAPEQGGTGRNAPLNDESDQLVAQSSTVEQEPAEVTSVAPEHSAPEATQPHPKLYAEHNEDLENGEDVREAPSTEAHQDTNDDTVVLPTSDDDLDEAPPAAQPIQVPESQAVTDSELADSIVKVLQGSSEESVCVPPRSMRSSVDVSTEDEDEDEQVAQEDHVANGVEGMHDIENGSAKGSAPEQESLFVEEPSHPVSQEFEEASPPIEQSRPAALSHKRPGRWSDRDTDRFYDLLRRYGEAYETIADHFAARNKEGIKRKAENERQKDARRFQDALAASQAVRATFAKARADRAGLRRAAAAAPRAPSKEPPEPRDHWSIIETEKFYNRLERLGQAYERMADELPGRDGAAVKRKFDLERREDPERVRRVLEKCARARAAEFAAEDSQHDQFATQTQPMRRDPDEEPLFAPATQVPVRHQASSEDEEDIRATLSQQATKRLTRSASHEAATSKDKPHPRKVIEPVAETLRSQRKPIVYSSKPSLIKLTSTPARAPQAMTSASPFTSQVLRSAGRSRPTLAALESSRNLRQSQQFAAEQERYSLEAIQAEQKRTVRSRQRSVDEDDDSDEDDGPASQSLRALYGKR